jgi:8-oxo-dGTP diphosphatase
MRYEITKGLPDRFKIAVGVHLMLMKDGQILLLRRAGTGWADGYFTLPAGHVDGNERLVDAACREAKEEVCLTLSPEKLQLVHVMHRSDRDDDFERLDFYFECHDWAGEPTIGEPDKSDLIQWVYRDAIPEKSLDTVKYVLAHYPGHMLSELNFDVLG